MAAAPTKAGKTTAERVTTAIEEAPGQAPGLEAKVEEQFDIGRFYNKKDRERKQYLEAAVAGEDPEWRKTPWRRELEAIEGRAVDARRQEAQQFVAKLPTSRMTRDKLREMGVGGAGFLRA